MIPVKRLVPAIACLILAVVIFVFAEGARRIYSGGFFAILGVVLLASALREDGRGEPQ